MTLLRQGSEGLADQAAPATIETATPSAAEGQAVTTPAEFLMPRHVAAVVPFADHEAFGRLTLEQKQRVSLLLQILAEMAGAPDGVVAAADRLAVAYAGNGFSAPNLIRLYYAFRKRGWRALAKIYARPAEQLPADFVQEFRRRVEASKREQSTKAVMDALKAEWAAGQPIPGYGTWAEYWRLTRPEQEVPAAWPFGFYPPGWGRSNLYARQPSRAQRAFARRGYAALQRYIPHVVRDTSSLRPLELITIDDFELDFVIRAFNPVRRRWEVCRCAGLLAMDVATRRVLSVALVPRFRLTRAERAKAAAHIAANAVPDEAGGEAETADDKVRRIAITRHDVQCLLHTVFSNWGRPAGYGCTILCENAAAAITPDFELALELLLQVQVARTGLIEGKTLTNGFAQGGGKPWQKGWIEALFRTIWNRLGAVPGQKGSSYHDKPADHDALVAYAEKLFAQPGLAPEQAAQLRTGLLTVDEALDLLHAVFRRLEARTEHKMIGFAERFAYRLPGEAGLLTEEALLARPQDLVLQAEPVALRESPAERWATLCAQHPRLKIAESTLACLLLTPKRITLRNLRLTFTHAGTGYTYADADSEVMRLPDGTEVLGYFDPARPGVLWVTDLQGRLLGQVRRRGAPVDILNHAAISQEAGEIARLVRACVENEVRARHEGENARLAADDAHNVALQRSAGIAEPVSHVARQRGDGASPAGASRAGRLSGGEASNCPPQNLPDAAPIAAPGHNGQPNGEPGTSALATTNSGACLAQRPAKILPLSQRLSRAQPPARDAFAPTQPLPAGIAATTAAQADGKARAQALQDAGDELDPGQLL